MADNVNEQKPKEQEEEVSIPQNPNEPPAAGESPAAHEQSTGDLPEIGTNATTEKQSAGQKLFSDVVDFLKESDEAKFAGALLGLGTAVGAYEVLRRAAGRRGGGNGTEAQWNSPSSQLFGLDSPAPNSEMSASGRSFRDLKNAINERDAGAFQKAVEGMKGLDAQQCKEIAAELSYYTGKPVEWQQGDRAKGTPAGLSVGNGKDALFFEASGDAQSAEHLPEVGINDEKVDTKFRDLLRRSATEPMESGLQFLDANPREREVLRNMTPEQLSAAIARRDPVVEKAMLSVRLPGESDEAAGQSLQALMKADQQRVEQAAAAADASLKHFEMVPGKVNVKADDRGFVEVALTSKDGENLGKFRRSGEAVDRFDVLGPDGKKVGEYHGQFAFDATSNNLLAFPKSPVSDEARQALEGAQVRISGDKPAAQTTAVESRRPAAETPAEEGTAKPVETTTETAAAPQDFSWNDQMGNLDRGNFHGNEAELRKGFASGMKYLKENQAIADRFRSGEPTDADWHGLSDAINSSNGATKDGAANRLVSNHVLRANRIGWDAYQQESMNTRATAAEVARVAMDLAQTPTEAQLDAGRSQLLKQFSQQFGEDATLKGFEPANRILAEHFKPTADGSRFQGSSLDFESLSLLYSSQADQFDKGTKQEIAYRKAADLAEHFSHRASLLESQATLADLEHEEGRSHLPIDENRQAIKLHTGKDVEVNSKSATEFDATTADGNKYRFAGEGDKATIEIVDPSGKGSRVYENAGGIYKQVGRPVDHTSVPDAADLKRLEEALAIRNAVAATKDAGGTTGDPAARVQEELRKTAASRELVDAVVQVMGGDSSQMGTPQERLSQTMRDMAAETAVVREHEGYLSRLGGATGDFIARTGETLGIDSLRRLGNRIAEGSATYMGPAAETPEAHAQRMVLANEAAKQFVWQPGMADLNSYSHGPNTAALEADARRGFSTGMRFLQENPEIAERFKSGAETQSDARSLLRAINFGSKTNFSGFIYDDIKRDVLTVNKEGWDKYVDLSRTRAVQQRAMSQFGWQEGMTNIGGRLYSDSETPLRRGFAMGMVHLQDHPEAAARFKNDTYTMQDVADLRVAIYSGSGRGILSGTSEAGLTQDVLHANKVGWDAYVAESRERQAKYEAGDKATRTVVGELHSSMERIRDLRLQQLEGTAGNIRTRTNTSEERQAMEDLLKRSTIRDTNQELDTYLETLKKADAYTAKLAVELFETRAAAAMHDSPEIAKCYSDMAEAMKKFGDSNPMLQESRTTPAELHAQYTAADAFAQMLTDRAGDAGHESQQSGLRLAAETIKARASEPGFRFTNTNINLMADIVTEQTHVQNNALRSSEQGVSTSITAARNTSRAMLAATAMHEVTEKYSPVSTVTAMARENLASGNGSGIPLLAEQMRNGIVQDLARHVRTSNNDWPDQMIRDRLNNGFKGSIEECYKLMADIHNEADARGIKASPEAIDVIRQTAKVHQNALQENVRGAVMGALNERIKAGKYPAEITELVSKWSDSGTDFDSLDRLASRFRDQARIHMANDRTELGHAYSDAVVEMERAGLQLRNFETQVHDNLSVLAGANAAAPERGVGFPFTVLGSVQNEARTPRATTAREFADASKGYVSELERVAIRSRMSAVDQLHNSMNNFHQQVLADPSGNARSMSEGQMLSAQASVVVGEMKKYLDKNPGDLAGLHEHLQRRAAAPTGSEQVYKDADLMVVQAMQSMESDVRRLKEGTVRQTVLGTGTEAIEAFDKLQASGANVSDAETVAKHFDQLASQAPDEATRTKFSEAAEDLRRKDAREWIDSTHNQIDRQMESGVGSPTSMREGMVREKARVKLAQETAALEIQDTAVRMASDNLVTSLRSGDPQQIDQAIKKLSQASRGQAEDILYLREALVRPVQEAMSEETLDNPNRKVTETGGDYTVTEARMGVDVQGKPHYAVAIETADGTRLTFTDNAAPKLEGPDGAAPTEDITKFVERMSSTLGEPTNLDHTYDQIGKVKVERLAERLSKPAAGEGEAGTVAEGPSRASAAEASHDSEDLSGKFPQSELDKLAKLQELGELARETGKSQFVREDGKPHAMLEVTPDGNVVPHDLDGPPGRDSCFSVRGEPGANNQTVMSVSDPAFGGTVGAFTAKDHSKISDKATVFGVGDANQGVRLGFDRWGDVSMATVREGGDTYTLSRERGEDGRGTENWVDSRTGEVRKLDFSRSLDVSDPKYWTAEIGINDIGNPGKSLTFSASSGPEGLTLQKGAVVAGHESTTIGKMSAADIEQFAASAADRGFEVDKAKLSDARSIDIIIRPDAPSKVDTIEDAALHLQALSDQAGRPVETMFEGVKLTAHPKDSIGQIRAAFDLAKDPLLAKLSEPGQKAVSSARADAYGRMNFFVGLPEGAGLPRAPREITDVFEAHANKGGVKGSTADFENLVGSLAAARDAAAAKPDADPKLIAEFDSVIDVAKREGRIVNQFERKQVAEAESLQGHADLAQERERQNSLRPQNGTSTQPVPADVVDPEGIRLLLEGTPESVREQYLSQGFDSGKEVKTVVFPEVEDWNRVEFSKDGKSVTLRVRDNSTKEAMLSWEAYRQEVQLRDSGAPAGTRRGSMDAYGTSIDAEQAKLTTAKRTQADVPVVSKDSFRPGEGQGTQAGIEGNSIVRMTPEGKVVAGQSEFDTARNELVRRMEASLASAKPEERPQIEAKLAEVRDWKYTPETAHEAVRMLSEKEGKGKPGGEGFGGKAAGGATAGLMIAAFVLSQFGKKSADQGGELYSDGL